MQQIRVADGDDGVFCGEPNNYSNLNSQLCMDSWLSKV